MTKLNTVGVDLAKSVIQVSVVNPAGKELVNKSLTRKKFGEFLATQKPSLIAFEACASAHHWARTAKGHGHEVRLLPAISVSPFRQGHKTDQNDALAVAERPLRDLPVRGELVMYAPIAGRPTRHEEVAAILERARNNPLDIPEPSAPDTQRLFEAFAPVWVVDTRDDSDLIGALVLGDTGHAQVEVATPVVYQRSAYTRYGDEVLLQLVYSVWFPARPRTSLFDLLGGHLDGVAWRVTLGRDGTPLMYDSIHNCGCYHQFFPTPRAQLRPVRDTFDEQAFVLQRLGPIDVTQRVAVRLEAGTHYIQRILVADDLPPDASRYALLDDSLLRSLHHPRAGRGSVFRPDGIIPGSERGERYLFWPMGVREPGAMRQWGRHATAFVGRRHFDEARLIERYFQLDIAPPDE